MCSVLSGVASGKRPNLPVAKIDNVIDAHWGVEVPDPYRYMENLHDEYVLEWFKGQADYADGVLKHLPGRDALMDRLRELDASKPYRSYSVRRLDDGTVFYVKRRAGENVGKLYRVDAASGREKLLVDPETMGDEDDQHHSLTTYVPSPNGRYVVYGIAQGGSEETVYHTLDLKTGDHVGQAIDRIETAYNRPHWHPDGSGFFYSRRQALPANAQATELYKKSTMRFHRLDTDPDDDPVIAGVGRSDRMTMNDVDFPSIWLTSGSDHAIVKISHGDSNELTLYTAPLARIFDQDVPWRQICEVPDAVGGFAVHGDNIYLVTADGAPRLKVVRTDLRTPDFDQATTVLAPGERVVDAIYGARDALYLAVMEDGVNRVMRIGYGEGHEAALIKLPDAAAGYVSSVSASLDGVDIYASSWTRGSRVYRYDPEDQTLRDTGFLPEGRYDNESGYTSQEVMVESHDGVMVPLSIIHRSDLKLDGSNPTLLSGYGSYSISREVTFSPLRLAWLEKGGIYAVAHVRGGGEYGQEWHYAGRMLNKPNTWKDFIACAEYLITQGYTSKSRLAGQGGSAGGILIGRAITERPELFAAAVMDVPSTDAIRMETTTNGVPNIQEFGTVTEEDGFRGLLEMSSYHHVVDGTHYPAVLLTHGFNDPRVEPWMSGKMAARLQAASASDRPVLMRIDYESGHGIGSTRNQVLAVVADTYAFLFWQLSPQE